MRVLVHDYSGHPFQAELSTALARRGHAVTHSWCEAYVSGKGRLADDGAGVVFEPIGVGEVVAKAQFVTRLVQELRYGVQLVRQAARRRPQVVLVANAPIPVLVLLAAYLWVRRVPWVLWHQDVQGVAVASFAGAKIHRVFGLLAEVMSAAERWCARRAAAVVVISDGFLGTHRAWGTADKVTVIPNWAPLDDIVPAPRDNPWSAEQGLAGRLTLLYAGTIGLKHRPELLTGLAAQLRCRGCDATLVVVNEGHAVDVLRADAARLGVPLVTAPFQPYERLSDVLGSGDVLVVLLDQSAGVFSVPSKTLSYLCAGRPVLGLMPLENLAATLVTSAGGRVLPAEDDSLAPAAEWVAAVLSTPGRAADLGRRSRELAEREFALEPCADRFEQVLTGVRRR